MKPERGTTRRAARGRRELRVLGSGSALPGPRPAGYLVRDPAVCLALDLGPGAWHSLHRHIPAGSLQYILLTHHHIDHCLDVLTLLFALPLMHRAGYHGYRPVVLGSGEALDALRSWAAANPFLEVDRVDWQVLVPGEQRMLAPHLTLRVGRAYHVSASLAYRLEWPDTSLVYSGDTGWSDELLQLAMDAHVLLLECSHVRATPTHLDPRAAAALARLAGVRLTVLTHRYPDMQGARARRAVMRAFTTPWVLARDGLRLGLPPAAVGHRRNSVRRAVMKR